jgi:hypothetical protein
MDAYAFLAPHWPGFAWVIIAMLIVQVLKGAVFTKLRAHKKQKTQWFWWWGYKVLPLQPMVLGALIGLLWTDPEGATPAWPRVASCIYFACFGGLSVWAFEVIKGLLKRRGIDLTIPGEEGRQ